MKTGKFSVILFFCAGLLMCACSGTRWVAEEESIIDKNEYKILDSTLFLQRNDNITPADPQVKLYLKSENTVEYAERVRTNRYIQNYKPRAGYVIFGLTSAAIAGYAAYSNTLANQISGTQKLVLTGAGLALAGISFLNMKPSGEPTPTGESRLLSKSGKIIQTDTLSVNADSTLTPEYEILLGSKTLVSRKSGVFRGDLLAISLAGEIAPEDLNATGSPEISLRVFFNDSTYAYRIPAQSVFEQFVVVKADLTQLRNKPDGNPDNVLSTLAKGSQLRFVSREGEWVKVLYGISENWVKTEDVDIIWRPSEFADLLSVIAVPNVPFGQIDVEKNIPASVLPAANRLGLILANGDYSGGFSAKEYTERDSRLMQEYFSRTLGVPSSNLLVYTDMEEHTELTAAFAATKEQIGQRPAELLVYLNGHARIDERTEEIYFLGTASDSLKNEEINLNTLFREMGDWPLLKLSIIADLDFVNPDPGREGLQRLAAQITGSIDESVVVFASETDQKSLTYATAAGGNMRHSIFTYFMASALQRGYTNWSAILNYVERNVSYTSRSLFNKAQDIRYFGDVSVDLGR